MRTSALFALLVFSLPFVSQGALKVDCPERMAHLGGLLDGIPQEQQDETLALVEALQKNGLFYTVLAEALKSNGITPQKPEAWKFFISDLILLPERQAIVDETAARLILEFTGNQVETSDAAVAEGVRTSLGVSLYMDGRRIIRMLEPKTRLSSIIEHVLFTQTATVAAQLRPRMRSFFARKGAPLLVFPPRLTEVRNAYSVLPVELVVFDAQRRLQTEDPADSDLVVKDLMAAGKGSLPVVQQAQSRAIDLRQIGNQQRVQVARVEAVHRAQSLKEILASIDEQAANRKAETLTAALSTAQERLAKLEKKRGKLLRRLQVQTQHSETLEQLAARPVEKTSQAVVAIRKAAQARRRFLRARQQWRKPQQPPKRPSTRTAAAPPQPSLSTVLLRDAMTDALSAESLNFAKIRTILLGDGAAITAEDFTTSASELLENYELNEDGDTADEDLARIAFTILDAANNLPFHLSPVQIQSIRNQLEEARGSLQDPDDLDDAQTRDFGGAQNSLQWLEISGEVMSRRGIPSKFELDLRKENFAFELALLDTGESSQIDRSLRSILNDRGFTPTQLTQTVIAMLASVTDASDDTRATVVEKLCTGLWGMQSGLSQRQIIQLRERIADFTSDVTDDDAKENIRNSSLVTTAWLSLASRYNPADDVADIPQIAAPPLPTTVASVQNAVAEILPPGLERLRVRAQQLTTQARALQQDAEVAKAYASEKLLRSDLRAVLSNMEKENFAIQLDAVDEILSAAHVWLSADRFAALFNEIALVHAFKTAFSTAAQETAYAKKLIEVLEKLPLPSANAVSIAEIFYGILGTITNESGNRLVFDDLEDTVIEGVAEWLFSLPTGLSLEESERMRQALRDLADERDSSPKGYDSAVWLRRWAIDRYWESRTGRTVASTQEKIRALENELAENEVVLQEARRAVAAAANTP